MEVVGDKAGKVGQTNVKDLAHHLDLFFSFKPWRTIEEVNKKYCGQICVFGRLVAFASKATTSLAYGAPLHELEKDAPLPHLVTDSCEGKRLVKQNMSFHESPYFIKSLFTPSAGHPCICSTFTSIQGRLIFWLIYL